MKTNDETMTGTTDGIRIDGIMELDPGPILNDHINQDDPKNCDPGTMCYDLVPLPLVASDHMLSTFQQGHQTFPHVKLNDNNGSALGHAYYFLLLMVSIWLTHAFDKTLAFNLHTVANGESNRKLTTPNAYEAKSTSHKVINMVRYNFYDESPNDFDFIDEDLFCFTDEGPGLSIDMSKIDHFDFYHDPEELWEHAGPSMMNNDFICL
jgi:hypothetical protein